MQRSINNLIDFTISAKDGELGKVSEFYFDDLLWSIRYLVVETGSWLRLTELKVLIPNAALGIIDWKSGIFHVNLTMEQVRKSPDIETEKTVSRQHEIELLNHYALPVYWGNGFYAGPIGMVPFTPIIEKKKGDDNSEQKVDGDIHLRSTKKVTGYHIHANDGEIGHVEDYIVDDEKWSISFLIVDTHNWLPGRKVLIMPHWINHIDFDESKVYVNLSKESIKNSPVFDSSQPVDKDYEIELFKHYGDKEIHVDKTGDV